MLKEIYTSWKNAKVRPLHPVIQKMDALDMVKNHVSLPNHFLFVTDYIENKITLMRGVETCLGYSNDEFNIQNLIRYIHPDDRNLIMSVVQVAWEELTKGTYGVAPLDWIFLFEYRILKKDGTYLKILQQTFITNMLENGQVIRTLDICTGISTIKSSNVPLYKITGECLDKFINKIEKKLLKLKLFSPRETEIVTLICHGQTNKKIASKLSISIETVKTYRKRIYVKAGCNNSSDLISYVHQNGLLGLNLK